MTKKKVLLITDVGFWFCRAGHQARISELICFLAQHVDLTVLYLGAAAHLPEKVFSAVYSCNLITPQAGSGATMDKNGAIVEPLLKDRIFDAVIIEYIHNTYFLQFVNDEALFILDTHDLISDRADEFERFNAPHDNFGISKELENKLFSVYDYVIAICQPDFEKIKSIIDADRVLLCPHAMKGKKFPVSTTVSKIVFVGSEYFPNVEALNHFISCCWPVVSMRYPIKLEIIGNVCKMLKTQDPFIILSGYQKDLQEIYRSADIVINPVRFGAGLKIKNVEALANGKPLLTTVHASRGLDHRNETVFMVAENDEEFTKKLLLLIEDEALREKLSKNAYNYMKTQFMPEACYRPLLDVINNL